MLLFFFFFSIVRVIAQLLNAEQIVQFNKTKHKNTKTQKQQTNEVKYTYDDEME
jgi:hypothetical protein